MQIGPSLHVNFVFLVTHDAICVFNLSRSALEGLDSLLLRASRKDPGASIDSMKAQIATALNALDRSYFHHSASVIIPI